MRKIKTYTCVIVAVLFMSISVTPQPRDSIFVVIAGDTVHIWNTGAFENCASLFTIDVTMANDTIYVTEIDTSQNSADCLCYFDLCASLTGLQSGNYEVMIFRKFPFLYPDTLFFIGFTSFSFSGSTLEYLLKSYQSECYYITGVANDEFQPEKYYLFENYPNPFNPTTTIRYSSPFESKVKIVLYNSLGELVTELVNEMQSVGYQETIWNASNVASGVYIYKINTIPTNGAKTFTSVKKMILIK